MGCHAVCRDVYECAVVLDPAVRNRCASSAKRMLGQHSIHEWSLPLERF
jgi:hypothetical protein